jgi:hypothetical protein
MKVRHHPLMSNAKGGIWPPLWKEKYGETTLMGEIGVLTHVGPDPKSPRTLYIHIANDNLSYFGRLIFDSTRFCHRISVLPQKHIGRPISEISDLEL